MSTVLVVGGGAREHAIAWKISQSTYVKRVLSAPGNGGTTAEKMENIRTDIKDHQSVIQLCRTEAVDLVMVGPEDPLAAGLADALQQAGIACFGPSAACAGVEADKAATKRLMNQLNIPTADFQVFTDAELAIQYIQSRAGVPLVVKASGLAAGKGVVVANSEAEACQAVKDMLVEGKLGPAGSTVVIEDRLVGEEVSLMAFVDGCRVSVMPPVQDHKRLLAGDRGPNTGGMGAAAPAPGPLTGQRLDALAQRCLQPLVDHWARNNTPYIGVLYAGLMVTPDQGPMVLEYNCRLGDPETQVLLPLLQTDLYSVLTACVDGQLDTVDIQWSQDLYAVDIVLVSGGYPATYPKGFNITGLDEAAALDCLLFHAGTVRSGEGTTLTSGGRVLNVVAVRSSLTSARQAALHAARCIHFTGIEYRKDIASRACSREILARADGGMTYKSAGVDIAAGDAFVSRIGRLLAGRPSSSAVLQGLGGFGGLYHLAATASDVQDPVLVAGTDGVGTKLKIAELCGQHRGLGVDLVAMCVNDLLCQGGRPLFFLDYLAAGRLAEAPLDDLMQGILDGCQLASCDLLGGETAEMPGVYPAGGYDLAGFAVGVVSRSALLPRCELMRPGDTLLALPASGLHSNGFSLVRRVVSAAGLDYGTDPAPYITTGNLTLGEVLLTPTTIYVGAMSVLLSGDAGDEGGDGGQPLVTGVAHITGGGLPGNLPRCLPRNLRARLNANTWVTADSQGARAAAWISLTGGVSLTDLVSTFNLGLGLVLVVPAGPPTQLAVRRLTEAGQQPLVVGQLEPRPTAADGAEEGPQVLIDNLEDRFSDLMAHLMANNSGIVPYVQHPPPPRKRVGVLISGSGTNLQALIDYCLSKESAADIVLVISNKPGVQGLVRAQAAGILTQVIRHGEYGSREEFDMVVHAALQREKVDLVCCAGFMRILSPRFVRLWRGRLLNIHPSLLPSFPGLHVHRQVLQAGVRLTGCTVHFIDESVDTGTILVQLSVPVLPGDTETVLEERVKTAEHRAYPQALHLLSTDAVHMDPGSGRLVWKPSCGAHSG